MLRELNHPSQKMSIAFKLSTSLLQSLIMFILFFIYFGLILSVQTLNTMTLNMSLTALALFPNIELQSHWPCSISTLLSFTA